MSQAVNENPTEEESTWHYKHTPEQTALKITHDPVFAIGENVREMMAAHIAQAIKAETSRLREALEHIRKLCDELDDEDGYRDIDALQVFENSVSDTVELALAHQQG